MNDKWTYYQYFKGQGYPVYIRANIEEFNADFIALLERHQFSILDEDEVKKIDFDSTDAQSFKLLTITEASPRVASEIGMTAESDKYGPEKITPRVGYKIYRYKGHGLMVYSMGVNKWELGVFDNFGNEEDRLHHDLIINRFLSWALASYGVCGFWGVSVEEGIVVLGQRASLSEAVYIDLNKNKVLSIDGERRIRGLFQVMRLDSSVKNKKIGMTKEELLGFLSINCTYMDFEGLAVPVRQVIHSFSKLANGVVYPQESYLPRYGETQAKA